MTHTNGNIYKTLFRLGLPVLVTQLGNIVVSMADTMMVGAYGTRELAAAAFVNNLFIVPIVMQMGFAGGVTPLVGALFGAKKFTEAGSMLRVALKLNMILALLVLLVMGSLYFALPHMGQPPELLPLIREYYLIVLGSVILASLFYPGMQMAMGVTDTLSPMLIIVACNILNCIGNYLLIFGHFGCPELGLNGAGISTLTARLLSTILMMAVIFIAPRYRKYQRGLRTRTPLKEQQRTMTHTSVPVMIQAGVETALWGLGAVVCGWYGKEQLAAFQVVLVMGQLGFMTYMSFATATSIRVANLNGIHDTDGIRRATRAGLHLNLGLSTLASLIFIIFGAAILRLFTSDATVIAIGLTLIPPLVLYQYADAIQMIYVNALRGTSKVRPLIPISIISYIIIGISFMLFMASGLDMQGLGVYYSFSIALIAAAIGYIRSFRRVLPSL